MLKQSKEILKSMNHVMSQLEVYIPSLHEDIFEEIKKDMKRHAHKCLYLLTKHLIINTDTIDSIKEYLANLPEKAPARKELEGIKESLLSLTKSFWKKYGASSQHQDIYAEFIEAYKSKLSPEEIAKIEKNAAKLNETIKRTQAPLEQNKNVKEKSDKDIQEEEKTSRHKSPRR